MGPTSWTDEVADHHRHAGVVTWFALLLDHSSLLEVRAANQDLSAEDAYRLAGFSEEVIRETLAADEKLKANNQ